MKMLVLFLIFFSAAFAKPLDVEVSAEAAILINADTGHILYEKNAHKELYPASITKIATALYSLKQKGHELDTLIPAPADCLGSVSWEAKQKANFSLPSHWLEIGGTHMGLKRGEELSYRDLMYGLMLVSGNDAANVLAQFSCGSISQFMKELNAYLKEIGCKKTNFCNPHGLHHPEHMSTAYDMAVMTKEALKHPFFREVVSTVRYERPKTKMQEPTMLVQHNRQLRKGAHYNPKVIGVKTGYIQAAGHTLVSAAEHEGRTLIAVLLKSKKRDDKFSDANKLFKAAFDEEKVQKILFSQGQQKYALALDKGEKPIKTYLEEDFAYEYFPAEEPQVKCQLHWREGLELPIQRGQPVGDLHLLASDGRFLHKAPLFAVEQVRPALSHRVKQGFARWKGAAFVVIGAFFVGFFLLGKK